MTCLCEVESFQVEICILCVCVLNKKPIICEIMVEFKIKMLILLFYFPKRGVMFWSVFCPSALFYLFIYFGAVHRLQTVCVTKGRFISYLFITKCCCSTLTSPVYDCTMHPSHAGAKVVCVVTDESFQTMEAIPADIRIFSLAQSNGCYI